MLFRGQGFIIEGCGFGADPAFCLKTGFGLLNLTFDLVVVISYKLLFRMDFRLPSFACSFVETTEDEKATEDR